MVENEKVDEPRSIRNCDSEGSSNDDRTMAVVNLPIKKRRVSAEANNVQSVGDDGKINPEKIADGAPSAINGEILEAAKLQTDRNPETKTIETVINVLRKLHTRDRALITMKKVITYHTDNTQGNDSGPGSRYFTNEDKCLSKKLSSLDWCSLSLDYFDALILTEDPDIGLSCPCTMTVFDGASRIYTMVLEKSIGRTDYFELGGDWRYFFAANNMKDGYEVTMYHLDRHEYSYVIKYFKKPADRYDLETVTDVKKIGAACEEEYHEAKKITSAPSNPLDPGSRNYQTEEPTLSKILTAYDVIKHNAVLRLDYYEAVLLTDDDYMNHENKILVYDEAKTKYYMVVSKQERSGGRVCYELGGDWKYFVGAHDLKAGDEVLFHEIDKEDSIRDENRFVVRYNRKPK